MIVNSVGESSAWSLAWRRRPHNHIRARFSASDTASSGTILATGTATVKVQQDVAVGMGAAADLADTGQAFVDKDDINPLQSM
jgi:hypothetical protein